MTARLLILPLILCLTSFVHAEKPALPSKTIPDGLGYNIHFTNPKPGEMEMLKDSGATIVRMDFSWDATERQKGVYDFSAFERLTDALEKHKIRPLYILDYSNRHYDEGLSPYSEEGRKAFARWATAAAIHFKGRGILWEMYNEPNISFWKPKPDPEKYILLATEVGKALRQAVPDELYIGPATSEMDFDFLEKCFQAGLLEYWDAVSVHPYRQKDPESVIPEYAKLRYMIDKYAPEGKNIPILSAEWGYSSAWPNYDDEIQGKMLPRQWMVNLACDIPISIWYDWHDDGTDPKEPEHHFGTTNYEYHAGRTPVYDPKPSYLAAKTFTETFDGFQYNKRLVVKNYGFEDEDPSPNAFLFLFNNGKKIRLAAWTTSKESKISIPCESETKFRIIDHLGQEVSRHTFLEEGLAVTDAPLYLIPENEDAILTAAAEFPTLPMVLYLTESSVKQFDVLPPEYRFSDAYYSPENFRLPYPYHVFFEVHADTVDAKSFLQCIVIHSTNPLSIHPSLSGNQMTLQIDNPSGNAFSGQLCFEYAGTGKQCIDIELKEGEKRQIHTFPIRPAYVSSFTLIDKEGDSLTYKEITFVPLDDFAKYTPESFEKAWRVTPDGDAKIASEQKLELAESGMVKLTYKFDAGWKFLNIAPNSDELRKIDGEPKSLSIRITSDGSGNAVRMRLTDSTGQTFQPEGGRLTEQGPVFFTFDMQKEGLPHWGGANDGVIHYPIRFDSIVIDGTRDACGPYNIMVSPPVLNYEL